MESGGLPPEAFPIIEGEGMTTVSLTVSEVFDIALKSYYAGKLAEAEQLCLKILSADPDSAATLNLLAVINTSLGRHDAALANYDRALLLRPDFIQALNNRGAVLKALGRYDEALENYDRARAVQPDHVEVLNNRAGVLQELGRYDEALEGYDRALVLRPDYPEALNNRGVTLQALGRHAAALTSYGAALALRPDFVEALVNRGISHYELKQFREAVESYDRAIALRPDHADALSNRGNALDELGRREEALASYNGALNLQPHHAEVLYNRGTVLHKLGRFDEALASYDAALTLRLDYPEALVGRGATLQDQKQFDEALKSYDRAIAVRPDYAQALVNRGATLHDLGRSDEALQSFERALASEPDNVEALTNRGVAMHDLARYDEALTSQERALAARPDDAAALNNRGVTLHKLRRLEEALASHDTAVASRPDYAEAFANRGVTLYDLKRFDEALASYDRAIALRPDYADAHFLKSLSSLVTGDFERGWIEYEWRHKAPTARLAERDFTQPRWLGEDDIAGKTILLHSEQGFGDTIQFCRYVPLVAARGAHVIMEVEEPLCELMAGLAGTTQIIAKGDPLPDFDCQCSFPSLPLAFRSRLETIPARTPYLSLPAQALEYWSGLIGPKRRTRIGLAWAGNTKHVRDRERSMRLRDLLPLLDIDATFVSLQKEVRPGDVETLENYDILQFGEELGDFSDTAALISQLDLVISVDTSVAHLAGALQKPVWILVTHAPDWRWLLDRDDSPWYPTARLFRQSDSRAWDGVIAQVRNALLEFTAG
ncbi:Tfp pilus assembly protein PilF [Bradyrhizobium canariense]|uniref:Tfp pilus assembly protein PilF n=2 Tax=Bradyrhizobium canariense TaxID=255045 RepID=A0A1H1ZP61_9BRAD|nr:Tfp pilus assembly protein PilF [Bradyrhizobium canariense]